LQPDQTYHFVTQAYQGPYDSPYSAEVTFHTFAKGDVNGDYKINFFDISALLATKYNTKQPATWAEGDQNGDGIVNFFDLTEVLAGHYNTGPYWTPPPQAASAAPAASLAPAAPQSPAPAAAFIRPASNAGPARSEPRRRKHDVLHGDSDGIEY
jgi:hypothetical protein